MEGKKPERGCSQGREARYERSAAQRALILDGSPSGGYDRHNHLQRGALLYCVYVRIEDPGIESFYLAGEAVPVLHDDYIGVFSGQDRSNESKNQRVKDN